jgi:hypothetical protein
VAFVQSEHALLMSDFMTSGCMVLARTHRCRRRMLHSMRIRQDLARSARKGPCSHLTVLQRPGVSPRPRPPTPAPAALLATGVPRIERPPRKERPPQKVRSHRRWERHIPLRRRTSRSKRPRCLRPRQQQQRQRQPQRQRNRHQPQHQRIVRKKRLGARGQRMA